jgi:3-(3-hydroxy-phenyl)propionate hydroxylase
LGGHVDGAGCVDRGRRAGRPCGGAVAGAAGHGRHAGNLAEKLSKVWRGEADPTILDRYVRQRRAIAIDIVQAMSIRNKERLQERDPAVRKRSREEMHGIGAVPQPR